jgi:hypothetical protein
VNRFLAGLGVAVGLAWLFRRKKKAAPATPADPADELRQKLAESRFPADQPIAQPESPEPTLDERRRDVHDRGRGAIERMQAKEPPQ